MAYRADGNVGGFQGRVCGVYWGRAPGRGQDRSLEALLGQALSHSHRPPPKPGAVAKEQGACPEATLFRGRGLHPPAPPRAQTLHPRPLVRWGHGGPGLASPHTREGNEEAEGKLL